MKKLILPALKNKNTLPDTVTLRRLNDLAYEFFETYPDSTIYYGELEVELAKKINDKKGMADGKVQVASVHAYMGKYTNAEELYSSALAIYIELNFAHGQFNCYTGLGSIYDYLGDYDKAISYYKKALYVTAKARNQNDMAEVYNLLGITYDNKADYSQALDNYFKSLIINIRKKDELSAADKYCNIGIIMHELDLYDKALDYYKRAKDIWTRLEDVQGLGVISQNIGAVLLDQGKFKIALPYLRYAQSNFIQMQDLDGISLIAYDLGLYKLRTGEVDSSIYYFNNALQSAEQSKIKYNKAKALWGLSQAFNSKKLFSTAYNYALQAQSTARNIGSLALQTDATEQASIALAGLNRFEQAYSEMLAYASLRSKLKHNESVQKIAFYNLEIEFTKEQKQIAEKQQQRVTEYREKLAAQRKVNLAYAGVTVIVAVMAGIYYRGRRRQKAINAVLQEKNEEILLQQADINLQSEKLNELNLLKDRLIGVLAHDLRAPISTLRGLFNLLIDEGITHTEFIEMTPTVFNKLEQTSDFLDTLLFWINSQVDMKESNIKRFDVADLVDRELEHLNDKIKQKELQISLKIEANVYAFAEPNSIRIVIHNLLTNAIKFSNRGGSIEISVRVNGEKISICIKDNGIGMSEQHLAGLFKSRVNSMPGTDNESGTGMGLLFCKDLIEKYKGKIWVESTLNVGSKLCFDLPAAA